MLPRGNQDDVERQVALFPPDRRAISDHDVFGRILRAIDSSAIDATIGRAGRPAGYNTLTSRVRTSTPLMSGRAMTGVAGRASHRMRDPIRLFVGARGGRKPRPVAVGEADCKDTYLGWMDRIKTIDFTDCGG